MPKSDKNVLEPKTNPSILEHIKANADSKSQGRSSKIEGTSSVQNSEMRKRLNRTPSRHQDFQHEGHYDIKYI